MENATQALLIASGVLIGILILSLAAYLFYIMGDYAADTQSKIDQNTVVQFNDKFLKYDGLTNLTMQDIITVKNYALENNRKVKGYNPSTDRAGDTNDFIDVYYAEGSNSESHNVGYLIIGKSDEQLLKDEIKELEDIIQLGDTRRDSK